MLIFLRRGKGPTTPTVNSFNQCCHAQCPNRDHFQEAKEQQSLMDLAESERQNAGEGTWQHCVSTRHRPGWLVSAMGAYDLP